MTVCKPTRRRPRTARTLAWWAAIFSAVFSGVFALGTPKTAAQQPDDTSDAAYSRLYFALQPPTDRDAERTVELVEELLASGRFGEAAPLIEQVLSQPSDYLDSNGLSLKSRLTAAIETSGEAGQRVIRSVLAGGYERELSSAKSVADLRQIVACHPPELFGIDGLVRLARYEEARGAYATAAGLWQRAGDLAPREPERFSDAAQANRIRAGLVSAANRPKLQATAASSREYLAPNSWTGPGGDAGRENRALGGPPIAWRTWRAALEPAIDEDYVSSPPRGSVGGVVAVGGVLLAPTQSGLVCFSADSGKRLWRVKTPDAVEEPRFDRLRGGIATDGRLVFVVEPITARRGAGGFGVRFGQERSLGMPPSRLAAYQIATGGQLRWRCGGGPGAESMSLLGPPAVAESRLYALAEVEQTVCLVSITIDEGRLEWVQPLVRCEQRFPLHAERIGITPTIQDNTIYCPTGRGAVAAVDPIGRQIKWVHYLQVDRSKARPSKRPAWRGFGPGSWDEDPAAWQHSRVVVQDGKVVVASPALGALETLDAETGELLWNREAPSELYLAGVVDGSVVTVDTHAIIRRGLRNGEELGSQSLPAGDQPAGEPLGLETGLVVPLESGRFALVPDDGEIDLVDPRLNPFEAAPQLGDLIYHRGAIYARSAGSLECFRQEAPAGLARDLVAGLTGGNHSTTAGPLSPESIASPATPEAAELLAATWLRSVASGRADPRQASQQIERLVAGPRGKAYAALYGIESAVDESEARELLSELLASEARREIVSLEENHWSTADRLAEARLGRRFQASSAVDDSQPAPTPAVPSIWSTKLPEVDVNLEPSTSLVANLNAATRRNRRRRQTPAGSRPLSFAASVGRPPSHHWRVEAENGETAMLVGANRWGERLLATPITSAWTNRSLVAGPMVGLPSDAYWNGWIGLRLEDGFAVYRVDETADNGPIELAWESPSASQLGFPATANESASEWLYAIGPWGTLSVAGNEVRCRRLATGDLAWRKLVPSIRGERLRLLVDRDQVLVAGRGEQGVRLSAISGETIDSAATHAPPRLWRAFAPAATSGQPGRVLVEQRSITGREYRLHTIDDFEATLWKSQARAADLATVTPGGLFAMLDKERNLTVVDLRTASERFKVTLPGADEPPIRAVRIREHAGRLLVEVDRTNPMIDRHRGLTAIQSQPMLTGELHCLDPQTGLPLWAGPAEVSAMCLLEPAVPDAPLLFLARSQRDPQAGDIPPALSLVTLDLATGGTVYANYAIPTADTRGVDRFWIKSESAEKPTYTVRLGKAWITLSPSDKPAPPRPPMLARVEDPIASRPKGAKDVGESVKGLFKSLFDD